MNQINETPIQLSPICENDGKFLYTVFASTRLEEMALTGWPDEQIEWFLQMQFDLQHRQWQQNYPNANFDLICLNGNPIGRFYVDRREDEIRIIDIAILPAYRGQGIGSMLITNIKNESGANRKKISLHVERYNPAKDLYAQLGFEIVEEGEVYFLMEWKPG